MEVDLAVIADAANVSQEGKLNILGVFDTIWTREFPFRHVAMVFVVRMRADFTEQGAHRMEVRLMDADGGQLFKAEGAMQVPGGVPGRLLKPHVIMGLGGISFQKPGDYSFEVIVDGQHMKSVPLYVMDTPPPRVPGKAN
jgi:hypothetical protein